MIKIYLAGGFGNNLYQLFAAYCLSKIKNKSVEIDRTFIFENFFTKILKIPSATSWTIHKDVSSLLLNDIFRDLEFNINNKLSFNGFVETINYLLKRTISKLFKIDFIEKHAQKKVLSFVQSTKYSKIFLPLGYYYNLPYKNFSNHFLLDFSKALNYSIEKYLYKKLNSIEKQKLENIGPKDAILHYRGGDTRDICQFDYYRDALLKLCEKEKFEKIYILTDDYERFKKTFSKKISLNFEMLDLKDILADFYALSKAGNVIASNSTFSWWAIVISKNIRRVFYPKLMALKRPLGDLKKECKIISI